MLKKSTYLNELDVIKPVGSIYFTKKFRAETLQPVLEFDNFKPRLKSSFFRCIFRLNGSLFGGR